MPSTSHHHHHRFPLPATSVAALAWQPFRSGPSTTAESVVLCGMVLFVGLNEWMRGFLSKSLW